MTRKRFALISILILILASFPVLAQESQDVVEQEAEEETEQESEIHEIDDVYRQMELFSTALSYVLRNYYEDLTKEDLEQAMNGAIRGMLQGLGDRYSFYQPETRRKREQEDLFFAKFGGLGIRILPSPDGFVNIVQPLDGTPAMRAGLHSGDKIIRVDGESIANMSIDDVVGILRGEVGTNVTITILRPGREMPFDVTVTRAIITNPSVNGVMIDDQIGYISIDRFSSGTPEELRKKIEELRGEGMNALILNLRNNTGGVMTAAVSVADAFLSEGVIVSTVGRLDKYDSVHRSEKGMLCPADMPLVVLVNENSASGSEIVAGALKDHKRGIILGEKTFGKGVVQQRFPLDDERAVSITVSIYKTPSGAWIHEKGIEPDIAVEQPNILEGEDSKMLTKFYEGEYVDKFVYDYIDKNPDLSLAEQLQALEAGMPELMKTLADNEITLSEKIVSWYVRRTLKSTKNILNIDLEIDLQLARAVEEIKKLMTPE
jgi:carboxyl-terminal processing protease